MSEFFILNGGRNLLRNCVARGSENFYNGVALEPLSATALCEYYTGCSMEPHTCMLYVDEFFNIRLPMNGNIIITLEPLPKALYLLFLRHPEGILLKKISDYREELEYIYRKVSTRKNPTVIRRLMNEITNPLNNALHKNLSTIRTTFLEKLPQDVAELFIPTRNRGRVKYVLLPASCIKLPVNLH